MEASKYESFDLLGLTRAEATDLAQFLIDLAPFGHDDTTTTTFSKVYRALRTAGIQCKPSTQWIVKRRNGDAVNVND